MKRNSTMQHTRLQQLKLKPSHTQQSYTACFHQQKLRATQHKIITWHATGLAVYIHLVWWWYDLSATWYSTFSTKL